MPEKVKDVWNPYWQILMRTKHGKKGFPEGQSTDQQLSICIFQISVCPLSGILITNKLQSTQCFKSIKKQNYIYKVLLSMVKFSKGWRPYVFVGDIIMRFDYSTLFFT